MDEWYLYLVLKQLLQLIALGTALCKVRNISLRKFTKKLIEFSLFCQVRQFLLTVGLSELEEIKDKKVNVRDFQADKATDRRSAL
jgi:hypothetical protein